MNPRIAVLLVVLVALCIVVAYRVTNSGSQSTETESVENSEHFQGEDQTAWKTPGSCPRAARPC